MRRYIRNRVEGGCYFFTLTLACRTDWYLVEHVDLLREAFRWVKRNHSFELDAIVILPEHLHCIWTLPEDDDDYSKRWFLIKSAFSRKLPKIERRSGSRIRRNERGIWQRRYWEHTIRDESDYARHMDYIHYNPIKHGLVRKLSDWPHSSFHRYVRLGLYPSDWAVDPSLQIDFDE